MKVNEGAFDRATRVVVGTQMAALGLSGVVPGAEGLALIMIGTVLLVTGTSGRCLLYRWLGWSTVPKDRRTGSTDRRTASRSALVPIRSTDRRARSREGR